MSRGPVDWSVNWFFFVFQRCFTRIAPVTRSSPSSARAPQVCYSAPRLEKWGPFIGKCDCTELLANITVTDTLPSTKAVASIKLPDYIDRKLGAQYFHQHAIATFIAASTFCESPVLDASVTIGTPATGFWCGDQLFFRLQQVREVQFGFTMTKPSYNASAILFVEYFWLFCLDCDGFAKLGLGAVVGEICRTISRNENALTVGCSHDIDPHTILTAKLNNHGGLRVLLQHELKPKSFLTISGSFDTKALRKCPKFGLGLSVKL
ncbi:hypothetical protein MLD38_002043 [Melastoma candidum]|uniref:Uncharacterized protein n=1 Tax=Melastoma candidum TaxID=119954 RepID=A0ACB9SJ65_9MYRT|nr:hypothetical protein MLD38_002043 [Melastoma candidum]